MVDRYSVDRRNAYVSVIQQEFVQRLKEETFFDGDDTVLCLSVTGLELKAERAFWVVVKVFD